MFQLTEAAEVAEAVERAEVKKQRGKKKKARWN